MRRLNAVLKAASDSYPRDLAIADTDSAAFSSRSQARSMRQRARYCMGASPICDLNLSANVERDMPAIELSSSTVQPRAGSRWIAVSTVASCRSARA